MTEELKVATQAPEQKRVKKPKSKVRKIIEWVLFGIFGALFAFVLAGNIDGMVHKNENYGQSIRFGMGSFIVLTSSMEPEIPQDSAIITFKEKVESFKERVDNGEQINITFANIDVDIDFDPDTEEFKHNKGGIPVVTNQVMTHRLREVHINEEIAYGKGRYIFIAAGINDGGYESNKHQYQIFTEAQYLGTVKVANAFLGKTFNFISSPIGLIILLLIPAAYLIVASSIDIFKAMKESEEAQVESAGDDRLAGLSSEDKERLKKELLDEMIKAKQKEKK